MCKTKIYLHLCGDFSQTQRTIDPCLYAAEVQDLKNTWIQSAAGFFTTEQKNLLADLRARCFAVREFWKKKCYFEQCRNCRVVGLAFGREEVLRRMGDWKRVEGEFDRVL